MSKQTLRNILVSTEKFNHYRLAKVAPVVKQVITRKRTRNLLKLHKNLSQSCFPYGRSLLQILQSWKSVRDDLAEFPQFS